MTDLTPTRPLPIANSLTEPYWSAVKDRRFVLPVCLDCEKAHFYPRSLCPHCGSSRLEWRNASGRGEVYSWTIVRRAPSPAFAADAPYVVAIVALDEGPHLMSAIVGVEPEDVRIGLPLAVDFLSFETESLPVFRPIETRVADAGRGPDAP